MVGITTTEMATRMDPTKKPKERNQATQKEDETSTVLITVISYLENIDMFYIRLSMRWQELQTIFFFHTSNDKQLTNS